MKKTCILAVSLLLALALTACGEEDTASYSYETDTEPPATIQPSSSEKGSVNLWKYYEDRQTTDEKTSSSEESTTQEILANLNTNRHDDITAALCAEDIVKQFLKAPSTAEVCPVDEMQITHLGNGEYMITGWVDAENSYGAMLRSDFIVTYTATKDGYKNGYAIIE